MNSSVSIATRPPPLLTRMSRPGIPVMRRLLPPCFSMRKTLINPLVNGSLQTCKSLRECSAVRMDTVVPVHVMKVSEKQTERLTLNILLSPTQGPTPSTKISPRGMFLPDYSSIPCLQVRYLQRPAGHQRKLSFDSTPYARLSVNRSKSLRQRH